MADSSLPGAGGGHTERESLFASRAIRVDEDVRDELRRRKLKGEVGYGDAIRRALDEQELRAKLERVGLTTDEVAELHWLEAVRP